MATAHFLHATGHDEFRVFDCTANVRSILRVTTACETAIAAMTRDVLFRPEPTCSYINTEQIDLEELRPHFEEVRPAAHALNPQTVAQTPTNEFSWDHTGVKRSRKSALATQTALGYDLVKC
jgi:hypothetical protein